MAHVAAQMEMKHCADIVKHAERRKQADVLKGAGDAARGNAIGLLADNGLTVEKNCSAGRLIDAGDQIKRGGFARPVGTDEGDEFAAPDLQIQFRHRR